MTRAKLKSMLSHPNTLTLGRIGAIPAVVVLMLKPAPWSSFLAALVFSVAAITDYLDGYYARTLGLTSNFGKIMDPVADKLLVSCSLIMLSAHGWAPAWMVCIIIGREIAVTGLRNFAAEQHEDVSATRLGKYKTGFQIAAIIPLLFHYRYFGIDLYAIGMFFLWGALVFTIWSGLDYFIRFKRYMQV